ncbi:MAG TPA: sigma-70 family RNA polymerase sigma factor [Vicinamibacterales bacterium]|nr:sigma-70 family RNA polymerase sigma factor [Vicinamibacterales bacterium]
MTRGSDQKRQFTELLDTYRGPLRRLCAAYAQNAADRDDLFQDILLALWRAMPAFRGDASVRTWVYRIAHNVALTRRTRRAQREAREQPLDEAIAGTTEMDFRRVALKQAIREMHPADRMLTLLWLEGLTAAEIEEVTGMKAATVAVRLSRIRKRLHPGSESYE